MISPEEKESLTSSEPKTEFEQVDDLNARPLVQVWENEKYKLTVTFTYRDTLPSKEWGAINNRQETLIEKTNG